MKSKTIENTVIVVWENIGIYYYDLSNNKNTKQIEKVFNKTYPINLVEIKDKLFVGTKNEILVFDSSIMAQLGSVRVFIDISDSISSMILFTNDSFLVSSKEGDLFEYQYDLQLCEEKNQLKQFLLSGITKIIRFNNKEFVLSSEKEITFLDELIFNTKEIDINRTSSLEGEENFI